MSSKKSYNRFFIIFQEEDKGYGISPDRLPTGYAKVETRNDKSKVTVYAQNLKPSDTSGCLYKCCLISHQDDKNYTVYLGIMNIDDFGRGEASWESGADNAFDSKNSIDKFNGAAIIASREGTNNIIAPLAGYMSKEKFNWRDNIIIGKANIKGDVQPTQDTTDSELSEEAKKFNNYENEVENLVKKREEETSEFKVIKDQNIQVNSNEEIKTYPEIETTIRDRNIEDNRADNESDGQENYEANASSKFEYNTGTVEDLNREKENVIDYKEESLPANDFDDYERLGHKKKQQDDEYKYEYMYNGCPYSCGYYCKHILNKMLGDILKDFEEIDMHKKIKNCKMWKIDMLKYQKNTDKLYIYPCYDLIFYPMICGSYYNYNKYINKYGHYIFGIEYDEDKKFNKLIFGIPGTQKVAEQPFQGRTGFLRWVQGDDSHGYWIMKYDPMTGIIDV